MPVPVHLPAALLHVVAAEARAAFPAECCGWLVGDRADAALAAHAVRACRNAQLDGGAGADHPTAPERGADTAYVIAGDDLLAFARGFDAATPPVVIYHSHPNGRAYFSATDRAVALSPWGDGPAYPVQHLVVGVSASAGGPPVVTEMALFAWSDQHADFVELARWAGIEP
ncbi:MAG: Mov34/MPN/PAD-1 family protein [Kofleriaceae bacterium]|jgi:proteasome lid subunit RPN8/RPN11|nr:Mov34/MPN/PAD-1 family protein [Kofleriaceae bacterium]MBP6837208.1 Mov34/MPN/PAD-1 family protein [Kofleriaceae bacterium]